MRKLSYVILFLSFNLLAFSSFAKIENDQVGDDGTIDNSIIIARINNDDIDISIPSVIFSFIDAEVKVKFKNPEHTRLLFNKNKIDFIFDGEDKELNFINGEASFKKRFDNEKVLTIFAEGFSYNHEITVIPLWAIILPIGLIIVWIVFMLLKKF